LPDNGVGYGVLRYLNAEAGEVLSRLPKPEIGFNYLGRFTSGGETVWGVCPEIGVLGDGGADPQMPLRMAWRQCIDGEGVDGPQLLANWSCSGADLERESAKSGSGWFQALEALTEYAGPT